MALMSSVRRRLPIIVAALVAALMTLELGLRVGLGLGRPLLYAADPRVGYINAPHQDVRRFGVRTRINSFGMRSDEVSAAKPDGVTRVLFVGDSVTFGTTYVDQDEIFTERIRAALTSASVPMQVLNASAGGWAADNEYEYLTSRGTFGAARVVFVLNSGDLDQPFAALEVSPQFPTRNPDTALGELWERYLQPRIDARIHVADPGSIRAKKPDMHGAAHVLETLGRAKSFADSQGAEFSIIFSPGRNAADLDPAWDVALRRFREWAANQSVRLLDMTPVYARHSSEDIYLDDIHLKPFAHQLIASEFMAWSGYGTPPAVSAAARVPDRTRP